MAIYNVTDFLALSKYSGQAPELLKRITADNEKIDTFTSSINERMEAVEAVIDTVSTQNIDDIEERVDALEEKVEVNAEHIALNAEFIEANTTSISDHETRIVSLEESQEVQDELISELESLTETQGEQISINTTSISALETRLTEDEQNIQGNAQDITILATQVNTNAENIRRILHDIPVNDLVELDERVDALEAFNANSEVQTIATVKGVEIDLFTAGSTAYIEFTGTTDADMALDELIYTLTDLTPYEPIRTHSMASDILNNMMYLEMAQNGNISVKGSVLTIPSGSTIHQVASYAYVKAE